MIVVVIRELQHRGRHRDAALLLERHPVRGRVARCLAALDRAGELDRAAESSSSGFRCEMIAKVPSCRDFCNQKSGIIIGVQRSGIRSIRGAQRMPRPQAQTDAVTLADRRVTAERRQQTLRTLLCSLYRGRRDAPRRAGGHGDGQYADVIRPVAAVPAMILLLSCADCLFTLLLLQRGAIGDALIRTDITLFVGAKLAITAVCVLFIVAHRHFRFFGMRGGHVLYGILAMYLGLVGYQVSLLGA
jgi:hypothetical protein